MAAEKLTLVDLRKAISSRADIEEGVAGAFLQDMLSAITEGLKQDKQVRINGLGTFKLQWVEPRKSVNISTGEPIVIDGYQKLSFTPEQSLKERVNEPFSDYAAVELNESGETIQTIRKPKADPIQKMEEQAEEIKDLLADLGTPVEAGETSETSETIETIEAIEAIETIETIETSETSETIETGEKPFRPWLVAAITMLVIGLLLVGAYFFLQNKIVEWADMLNGRIEHPEQIDSQKAEPSEADSQKAGALPADTLVFDDVVEEPQAEVLPAAPNFMKARVFTEFIGTETVASGSRLTWIAKKYYGKKDLWVFIYEANRDHIKNPANVTVGSELQIPVLPDSVVQLTSPALQDYVKQLQDEYLGNR